ncbi:hypothetical protein QFC20_004252 [Naganishia adeliensis]|uniref:Uncharacterized protein n=1 Tax=Naganishia adeliensis TaxID=92952 RepID=A0ACC2W3S7_9TREE|nr:hypothetical protein QFC20_004252 [Naganishia adeliensis]
MSPPSQTTTEAKEYRLILSGEQKAVLDEIWATIESEATLAIPLQLLKEKCEVAIAKFAQDAVNLDGWLRENTQDSAYKGRRLAYYQLRRMCADLHVLFDACKDQLSEKDKNCDQWIRLKGGDAKEAVLCGTREEYGPEGARTTSTGSSRSASEDPAPDPGDLLGGGTDASMSP